jgi:FKBP-type peptidyl-prolyl cis-trans isomerase
MKRTLTIVAIVAAVLVGLFFALSKPIEENKLDESSLDLNKIASPSAQATSSADLKIEDLKVGTGSAVKSGDTVKVHYLGTLLDGTKFDSSYDRNQPFETKIGVGQVIQGWDQGIVGMKVGGKRKLTVPPELGYGSQVMGNIPANSTLVFEVELLEIK